MEKKRVPKSFLHMYPTVFFTEPDVRGREVEPRSRNHEVPSSISRSRYQLWDFYWLTRWARVLGPTILKNILCLFLQDLHIGM